jgi:alpha-tubulin suppressor-like RCC1 family protein
MHTHARARLVFLTYIFSGVSAVAIALGEYYSCAIVSEGGVKCWGDNGFGQLGIGSTSDATRPADVAGDGGLP